MIGRFRLSVSSVALNFWLDQSGALRLIGVAPPVGTVTVNVVRSDLQVGPETIAFEISSYSGFVTPDPTGTFDERFADFVFLWDFGDPGKTFPRVPRLRPEHNNANVAYGPEVAHTYQHGTYTASVLVIEPSSGRTAEWSQEVTILNPDTYFTTTGVTITVHPTPGLGDFTGLRAAIDSRNGSAVPCRIELARGQTFDLEPATRVDFGNRTFRNIYVTAASGAGARPIVRWNTTAGLPTGVNGVIDRMSGVERPAGVQQLDCVWNGIDFRGLWDADTQPASEWYRFFALTGPGTAPDEEPNYLHIHDCTASGIILLLQYELPKNRDIVLAIAHCDITNWADYGAGLLNGNRIWVIGTSIKQNPNAATGGTPKNVFNNPRNMHGPIRIAFCSRAIIDACDMFTNNGWTSITALDAQQQPCFRWGQQAEEGDRLNMQRTIMEGGSVIGGGGDANYDSVSRDMQVTHNVRIEKCYFLGSFATERIWETQYGGLTMRNNVAVFPAGMTGAATPNAFLNVRVWQEDSPTSMERILIEHNTIVNLRSGTAVPMITQSLNGGGDFGVEQDGSKFIVRNNAMHQPSASPAANVGPLSTATFITPAQVAVRLTNEGFSGSTGGSIPPSGSFTIAYSTGSFAGTLLGTQTSYRPEATNFAALFITGVNGGNPVPGADYSITYEATVIRITNTGSGTWPSATFTLRIERAPTAVPPPITSYATPLAGGASHAPLTGSPLLNPGGVTPAIRDDFFGAVRPAGRDLGAIQVTA
jgi:hypothetical protein